ILPYIEQDDTYKSMNLDYAWNDMRAPQNQAAAKVKISVFLCPSTGLRVPDPSGYAGVDYMPIVLSDIDPVSEVRNKATAMVGMMQAYARGKRTLGQVTVADGTSNTLMLVEDYPRNYEGVFPFTQSTYTDPVQAAGV